MSAVVEKPGEAVDEVTELVDDDHEVLQSIASKEKVLLEIWEHGPAQLTVSQDMRIAQAEETCQSSPG